MKIAALVIANDKPLVLEYTASRLTQYGIDIFVHVDAKVDIEAYRSSINEKVASYINWIPQRMAIFWAGYSMIDATWNLVHATDQKYDRYLLISDDSVPIIPIDELFLNLSFDIDRISARKLQPSDKFKSRYDEFFYLDSKATALRGRTIENSYFSESEINEIISMNRLRSIGKSALDVYYGSQWWALTADTVFKIEDKLAKDRNLLDSFKYSAVPDEIMFQTLTALLKPDIPRAQSPMSVDWTKLPKPYVYKNISDLSMAIEARKKDSFFLRKIANSSETISWIKDITHGL